MTWRKVIASRDASAFQSHHMRAAIRRISGTATAGCPYPVGRGRRAAPICRQRREMTWRKVIASRGGSAFQFRLMRSAIRRISGTATAGGPYPVGRGRRAAPTFRHRREVTWRKVIASGGGSAFQSLPIRAAIRRISGTATAGGPYRIGCRAHLFSTSSDALAKSHSPCHPALMDSPAMPTCRFGYSRMTPTSRPTRAIRQPKLEMWPPE
jgi:hypothetical protein